MFNHSSLAVAVGLLASGLAVCEEPATPKIGPEEESKKGETKTLTELTAERNHLDKTVYRNERQAQAYEQVLVKLWDRLRAQDAFEVLSDQPFESLTLLSPDTPEKKDWGISGITVTPFDDPGETLDHPAFLQALKKWKDAGWILEQSEWHHERFEPANEGAAPKSYASASGHLVNAKLNKRIILKGKLAIEWSRTNDSALPLAKKIEVASLKATERTGDPPFSPMARIDVAQESGGRWKASQPILLHDLNGDGLSEIILAGANLIYHNKGDGNFAQEPIRGLNHPLDGAAVIADFTGDGLADLLGTPRRGGILQLLPGATGGTFEATPSQCFQQPFEAPQGITAGDIDSDGDLDLFVFQYRQPYVGGQMPTPYYDANDGHPSFLLRNEGNGTFTDITDLAGLGKKRNRRTYSACLIDLNSDGHLDLSVVSDFAGIDLYYGDGKGGFSDVTNTSVDQRHAFGMAQTLDDFDNDGALDLYMIGMSSTTARRIVALGIDHPDHPVESKLRSAMGYGNRLYFSRDGKFQTASSAHDVARTGWSWGVSSADFDNDGDRDLYVANGHVSGQSCQDYCTRFWSHDIYTNNSKTNPVIENLFFGELQSMIKRQTSWNGYEKNVFYLNNNGNEFLSTAYLLGVAFEFDSRAAGSDDFDGDGLTDLLVVELDQRRRSEVIHVLRNRIATDGNWLGVRLEESPKGPSTLGAKVFLHTPSGKRVSAIVAGDSFQTQHAPVAHFGLGNETVEKVEIHWPNGAVSLLPSPKLNTYLRTVAPATADQ